MALNTIKTRNENISQEEAENKDAEKTETENPVNMVTIDRVKAEKFLLVLEESLGDIEEQKNLVDILIKSKNQELQNFQNETIEKFNLLIETTSTLAEKLEATESYEDYLAEKIENANLSKSVALLEQQLQKEKAEFSTFMIKTDNFLTMKIGEIEENVNKLKATDDIIETNIKKFKDEMLTESKKHLNNADNKINEASDTFIAGAKNQYASLKADCNEMLKAYTEKCIQHLDTVKKQSLDFLKQCENENKKLIEKVPSVADRKISIKDICIFALVAVSLFCNLFQLLH